MKARACLLSLLLLLPGCIGGQGFNPMSNIGEVQLSEADFTIVASGVRGEASCGYLFNLFPMGDVAISTRAMDELIASADVDGKSRGLVNFSWDNVSSNYFLFSVQTVKMRADVVEFR